MLKLLSGVISSDWNMFGNYLEASSDFLKSLRESPMSNNQKLARVIEDWLSRPRTHCTWNKVIEALENLGNGRAAYNVRVFLGEKTAQCMPTM